MRAAASSGAARCLVKGSSQCLARVPTARHLGPRCALPAALWPARSLVSASRFSINPWSIVDGLRGPWLLTDAVLDRLGVTANHSALDRFVAALRGKSFFFPYGFFPDGWGDVRVPATFYSDFQQWRQQRLDGILAAAPIDIEWGPWSEGRGADVRIREGKFASPFSRLDMLPEESHTAYVQLVVPKSWDAPHADGAPHWAKHRPVTVVLAGTGEQRFQRRRHFLAYPLARAGVASLILESPFYGARKPPNQKASKLRHVSDLPVLGRATLEEARSLIAWLGERDDFGPMCLAGTSMGGLHSAMAAAVSPVPVAVASWLGPTSAAPVFTEGALSLACEWKHLVEQATADDLEEGLRQFEEAFSGGSISAEDAANSSGGHQDEEVAPLSFAKRQMRRYLALTCLTNFPAPVVPSAATFVVARQDRYVLPEVCMEQWGTIQRQWEGCDIRWIRGGHVSATIFPREQFSDVVLSSLTRLVAAMERREGELARLQPMPAAGAGKHRATGAASEVVAGAELPRMGPLSSVAAQQRGVDATVP